MERKISTHLFEFSIFGSKNPVNLEGESPYKLQQLADIETTL